MKLDADYQVAGTLKINNEIVGAVDIVTMDGLESIASYLGSPYTRKREWMPFIGVGQGATEPSTEDRHLENEKYRKLGTVSTYKTCYIVQARFGINEPGTYYILREVGIFNKIVNGIMAARWVTEDDHYIQVGDEVDITCNIWFTKPVNT